MINCPNCGAPINFRHPYHCDYCGSSLNPEKEYEQNTEIERLKAELYRKLNEINNAYQSAYILRTFQPYVNENCCCTLATRHLHDT